MLKYFFSLLLLVTINFNALAEPVNLAIVKQQLTQYQQSGDYNKELTQVAKKAQQYIQQRIKTNRQNKPLALVLDIDETTLSNYPAMKRLNFGGTLRDFDKAIDRADAPPIKPMLSLYNFALKHKVSVFFITGRHESQRQATSKNLKLAGFNHWQQLILKPNNYKHRQSVIPYKSGARKMIESKGYTIIASIGDQYSDYEGGYTEKGFKLPNPYYFIR